MQVDIISTRDALNGLKQNWDDLYQKDPEAQFFLSWTFLSSYMRRYEDAWSVLAVRPGKPGSPYVALLPLRLRTRLNKKTGICHNEINMAGNYAADYAGIVCAPGYAERAIPALAKQLLQMNWAKLHLENLRMSEKRRRLLLENLADKRLTAQKMQRVNKTDNVDNCICPATELPGDWDTYLERKTSSNTRQKIRRFLRKLDGSDEFRITHADASTIDRDIEAILEMWRVKWAPRKGNLLPGLIRSNRILFKDAFASGTLFLPILWQGDKPLGGLAFLVDPVKKTMLFHLAGRDETANDVPSGLVLHGYCIRHAIAQGFRTYDFLRGNEPYKYSYGVDETTIHCVLVKTRTGRNLGDRLDPRSVASVLEQATKFHEAGNLANAENGYRQILEVAPRHGRTLYGLGQLLAAKADHWSAADIFKVLVEVAPNSVKAWSRLAIEYQTLARHAEAADAFRKVLELNPELSGAQYGLGRSLAQLRQMDEAAKVLSAVEDKADPVLRAKTRAQLQKLKDEANPCYLKLEPAKVSILERVEA
ncbi:GNAT family N-acetyltransferase [Mesorhizobium sp. CU2]|uniref:GNAT family N-acetyltransferase n=1 Tax=unclassified Mesorhizobium TaxID=325217 RepID=UPI00112DD6C3|nr:MULTISPECIES: GNAT family N-acetyltransferase [unclassified Mesorhizobium]TPN85525.1 GNAT family N-acetyltransferase [Mesorhizobium sp. CU3]TPO16469.1 GNAT family N-acetyltransferase [Mesorhizobium sp. CU2]